MRYTPTKEQCLALLKKHGITKDAHETELVAIIKEAYRAGTNAYVMQVVHKEEKKNE